MPNTPAKTKPRKLTVKQERFTQAWHATGNATQAYRDTYDCANMAPTTISHEAYLLSQHHLISARLEELQAQAAEYAALTPAKIATNLLEDRQVARRLDNPAAMITADTRLGEMIGVLGTRRSEHSGTIRHEHIVANLADMDPDALRALVELGKRLESGAELPALPEPTEPDTSENQD